MTEPKALCKHEAPWGFCCHFPLLPDDGQRRTGHDVCSWCGAAIFACTDGSWRKRRGEIGCEGRNGLRHEPSAKTRP